MLISIFLSVCLSHPARGFEGFQYFGRFDIHPQILWNKITYSIHLAILFPIHFRSPIDFVLIS